MSIAKKVRKNNEHYMNNIIGHDQRNNQKELRDSRDSRDVTLPKIYADKQLENMNLNVQ